VFFILAFAMRMLRRGLRAYWRDQKGAYAVMFALMGGFIAASAQIGATAFRTQNSTSAAEQLIDLTCQKLSLADPALYPTGAAAAAAAEQALNARMAPGLQDVGGRFTVRAESVTPEFVVPINEDRTMADLRRFEFVVRFTGEVTGINRLISNTTSQNIGVTKRCRPICTGMTNVVYSSPAATGHWIRNNWFRLAQTIDDNQQVVDGYEDAIFREGFQNPADPNTRFVLTLLTSGGEAIRYRSLISAATNIYIDADRFRQRGEPSLASQRLVVDDDDEIVVQALNADGSLPGMCGPSDEVCLGDNCGGDIGEPEPPETPRIACVFNEVLPRVRPFPELRRVRFADKTVRFDYPNEAEWQSGMLTVTWPGGGLRKRLAPFYISNPTMVTVRFRDGLRTVSSEVASALGLTIDRRFNILRYRNHNQIVHMSGVHWFYFWNGRDLCKRFRSPIVFDTEGLGEIITTSSLDSDELGPAFDMFGRGEKEPVEWPIGKGQAWLVDNRDGRAATDMTGKRFFGDLDGHEDGYQKLRELDTSGTGILSGADLDGLVLWFDNGNALVEENELLSLRDVGVTKVDTRAQWSELPDGRSVLRSTAIMNGRSIMTEDIFVSIASKAVPVTEAAAAAKP
jgi:Flp pilus assembly pilin Flp